MLIIVPLLSACGGTDATKSPEPTKAATTTAPAVTTVAHTTAPVVTTTVASTTAPAVTTTVASTTAPAVTTTLASTTAPAVTVASTAIISTTSAVAPIWFKDLPSYPGTGKLELDSATLGGINISTAQYYVTSNLSSDSVTTIADFYVSKLVAAGWQKTEQTPMGKLEDGQRITFTLPQNGITRFFRIIVATKELLAQLPSTTGITSKMDAGKVLIILIAQPDAPDPTPVAPATTGLPAGVAAKNLTFDFGDGWVAQGQITYPAGQEGQKFPTVILVHGSGLNDMDENLPEQASGIKGGSKPFQQIAYYLPTRGVAVIRYNKRGVTGLGPQVSSNLKFTKLEKPDTQYALDAAFVLNQALKNSLVDPNKVIMLGHSEGTLNVSHVAVSPDGKNVAGVVLLGVAGYDAKTILQYQLVDRDVLFLQQDADLNKDGKVTVEEFLNWVNSLNSIYKDAYTQGYLEADSSSPLKYKFRKEFDKNGDGLLDLTGELKPYLQTTIGIDNFPNLNGLPPDQVAFYADWQQNGSVTSVLPPYKGPVLMMNGEADTQTVVQGARDADAALAKAGNSDHTLKTYPGLGHSFYPAKGLSQPLGPIQDNVLKDLGDWLAQRYLTK
jgi:pimeloyl-ACP methyl ester carboxylesterase